MIQVLAPDWPVPKKVRGFTSFRHGGMSRGAYASLNLGLHVGDNPEAVLHNRQSLQQAYQVPNEPHWLEQTHGTNVIRVTTTAQAQPPSADGSYTKQVGQVLAVLTADCLPLFLASLDGKEIALVHCGWRGVAQGIIANALAQFQTPLNSVCAWLGPAISSSAFEVGADVLQAMVVLQASHSQHFIPHQERWLLDLFALVTDELQALGVEQVYRSQLCTVANPQQLFSYRRDGVTGRMASLLWCEE